MISVGFQGKTLNITVIQVYIPTTNIKEAEVEQFFDDLLELTPKKGIIFIIGNWNAKVGSQEIPGVKKSLALEYKMKQDKSKQSFCKRMHWSQQTPSSNNTRDNSTHGHYHMVNTKIRLIHSLQAKMENLHTVSKNKTRS